MPNNPLTVEVTITANGNSLSISVDKAVLQVPSNTADPEFPIFWAVSAQSSAGAQITNVTFPWPAPSIPGYTFTQWPGAAPAQQGNNWKVTNRNNSTGSSGNVYFKYNIYASVGTTTGELDPIIDNQPPPTQVPHPFPKPQNH